jgi:hypothetical protein
MCVGICMCVCVCVCLCVCVCTCVYVCGYLCVCVCFHTGSGSGVGSGIGSETLRKVGSGSEKNHSGSTTLYCLYISFRIQTTRQAKRTRRRWYLHAVEDVHAVEGGLLLVQNGAEVSGPVPHLIVIVHLAPDKKRTVKPRSREGYPDKTRSCDFRSAIGMRIQIRITATEFI